MLKLLLLILALPASGHPVPESSQWLTYQGDDGPGKGKHIVLIAADQEHRSEQSMPMMAKILSTHRGRWYADSTRGTLVEAQQNHPIVIGVSDIWGNSDVYRTYKDGTSLPEGCAARVWGQPLMGRNHDDPPNAKLKPLPVAWFKTWQTRHGKSARVFHPSIGGGTDLQSAGLRRLIIRAVYWGMGLESSIQATSKVEMVGDYKPLESGFNYEKLGVRPKPMSAYK